MTAIVIAERLAALDGLHLERGEHSRFDNGHCAMEVAAWLAGEKHTDHPECVSPVLAAYVIRINDRLDDEPRQALKPFLPRLLGTAGDGQDAARVAIAKRALTQDLLQPWLRLAGLDEQAEKVASWTGGSGSDLRRLLWQVRDDAWAKRQAARSRLEAKITEHLKGRGSAVAGAAAVAAAVAGAAAAVVAEAGAAVVAEAGAAAVAEAGAEAAVVAEAGAAAVAEAEAAAAAVAEAEAAAAAVAEADPWGANYQAAKKVWREWYVTTDNPKIRAIRDLAAHQRGSGLLILERMIDPAGDES